MDFSEIVLDLALAAFILHMYATYRLIEYLKSEHRDIWERLEKPAVLFGSFRSSSKFMGFVARGHRELQGAEFASRLFFVRASVFVLFLLTAIYLLLGVVRALDVY